MQTFLENASQLNTDETFGADRSLTNGVQRKNRRLQSFLVSRPSAAKLRAVAYSFADQALTVGGMFLVNVMLARTQTKEEYGMFALSYSVFTFLTGLHDAAILEPFTVYGSGRYRGRFSEYLRLMTRANALLGLLLSGILLLTCLSLWWVAPKFASRALLGLGLTVGVLLSGVFLRRAFYVQRRPGFSALTSCIFFVTATCGLWLAARAQVLNAFSVFLILAVGWIAAGIGLHKKLALGNSERPFLDSEPGYWREHWKYSRWVLATAFVFQFTTQGYYWLVAAFLSVKQVAELRAIYMIVAPVDQVFVALTFLVLPALAARYAGGKMQDFFSFQKRYGLGALATTGLFALAVQIAGRPAMHLLYAGRFDDVAPLLYVLAFLPVIMGLGNSMNAALKAMEKPNRVFYAYAASAVSTFFIGIPLVLRFGLCGAVFGMLVSGAVYTITLGAAFYSYARLSKRPVQPYAFASKQGLPLA